MAQSTSPEAIARKRANEDFMTPGPMHKVLANGMAMLHPGPTPVPGLLKY